MDFRRFAKTLVSSRGFRATKLGHDDATNSTVIPGMNAIAFIPGMT